MEKAVPHLRKVLETGLLGGLWSITQFNRPSPYGGDQDVVLPSLQFLEENERFKDPGFRDLEAYANRPPAPLFP